MEAVPGILDLPNDPTPWLRLRPNDDKEYCVLWLQGWTSTIEKHRDLLERLAKQTGTTFAIVDYAGHGSHPLPLEDTTREQQFNEVLAAFDAMKAEGYKNIIVAGTSFGGYMTALLTAQRDPYAVILRAPAIYKDDEFSLPYPERQGYLHEAYGAFKTTISPTSDLDALRAVASFKGTVYVVEHETDSVIPRNIPQAYFAATKRGNYLVVPATDHSPAKATEPEKHFRYIELVIADIVGLLRQESAILS